MDNMIALNCCLCIVPSLRGGGAELADFVCLGGYSMALPKAWLEDFLGFGLIRGSRSGLIPGGGESHG